MHRLYSWAVGSQCRVRDLGEVSVLQKNILQIAVSLVECNHQNIVHKVANSSHVWRSCSWWEIICIQLFAVFEIDPFCLFFKLNAHPESIEDTQLSWYWYHNKKIQQIWNFSAFKKFYLPVGGIYLVIIGIKLMKYHLCQRCLVFIFQFSYCRFLHAII